MADNTELYLQFWNTWKLLHPSLWKRYAADPENEKMVVEAAFRYKACLTAVDRAFADVSAKLIRTDGKSEADDALEYAQQIAERESQLEANIVVTKDDYLIAISLSPRQLASAYNSDPAFARKYRKLRSEYPGLQPIQTFSR